MARQIKVTFSKHRLGEQPEFKAKTPHEGLRELEEIRRMFPELRKSTKPAKTFKKVSRQK